MRPSRSLHRERALDSVAVRAPEPAAGAVPPAQEAGAQPVGAARLPVDVAALPALQAQPGIPPSQPRMAAGVGAAEVLHFPVFPSAPS
jgi:hypothetical protein